MRWLFNVLSWHFACLALALLLLRITPLAAKVMADSPPPTTSIGPPPDYNCYCNNGDPDDCGDFGGCVGGANCGGGCASFTCAC